MFSDFFKGPPELPKTSPVSSDHLHGVRALMTIDVLPSTTTRARGGEPKSATLANKEPLSKLDAIVGRSLHPW